MTSNINNKHLFHIGNNDITFVSFYLSNFKPNK